MTTFNIGGSAVAFATSGTAVSFAVTATTNDFITSQFVTPGAHASSHGAAGSDPITTLGAVAHSGQQTFAAGSAAAPSIAATGDTNTGLYFPAADTAALATGGTARIYVNGNGSVGIGTTAPGPVGPNLEIVSNTSNQAQLRVVNTNTDSTGPYIQLRKAPTDNSISASDNLGTLSFHGSDSGGTVRLSASIVGVAQSQGASYVEGNLDFYTVNSSGTNAQKMRINSTGLITGAGPSLGAWVTYTPTLGGFTAGSGAITGAYVLLGKICHFRASWTYGSGSAAATAFPTLTLPTAALAATNVRMEALFFDTSASAYYDATSRQSSTTVVTMGIPGASGIHTTCTTTTPFTWATGDQIILSGTYEIA